MIGAHLFLHKGPAPESLERRLVWIEEKQFTAGSQGHRANTGAWKLFSKHKERSDSFKK